MQNETYISTKKPLKTLRPTHGMFFYVGLFYVILRTGFSAHNVTNPITLEPLRLGDMARL